MPTEYHKVGRYTGGNIAPTAANPMHAQWNMANGATNGDVVPDLAALCFDHSSRRRALAGSGASHGTCFAIVEHYNSGRNHLMYKFGDSGLLLELLGSYTTTTGRLTRTLRGHAEISALAQAINSVVLPDNDYANFVTRIYIELSPCNQCLPQLADYIPNSVVMYSYDYHNKSEMNIWVADNQAGIHEYGGKFR
jgi:deoxycytidylate deaminase